MIPGSGLSNLLLQVALPSAARPAVVAVGVLYFAVVIGISVWAARRTHTASDFFVGGKGIGLIALTVDQCLCPFRDSPSSVVPGSSTLSDSARCT